MRRREARQTRQLVSWPLYRLLMLIAVAITLTAGLLVRQPALPPPPQRPVTFNGSAAATLAAEMPGHSGQRGPGEVGDRQAADWVQATLRKEGYRITRQDFGADLPGQPNIALTNVIGYLPGSLPDIVAVIAHRDGTGAGAIDNASGTGVLLELAREMAAAGHRRGLAFVSTDGGTTGGQGAARLASSWDLAHHIVAAIVLDSVAAPQGTPLRLVTRSAAPRGTGPMLYAIVRNAVIQTAGRPPRLPGPIDQLTGYAIPYAPNEQGPLIAGGVPAVTLTGRPAAAMPDSFTSYSTEQFGQVGRAVATALAELDAAPTVDRGGPPVIFFSGAALRGWLAEVVLAALWLLAHIPVGLMSGVTVAPQPGQAGATTMGTALAAGIALLQWRFVVQPRVARVPGVSGADRTSGLTTGLLWLSFPGLLLAAIDPFTLIVVLPAAHAWLLLPVAARLSRRIMLAVYLVGLAGPLLVLGELAVGQHLGLGAGRALVAMAASGYLSPTISVCLALAAGAGAQVASIVTGRYAPAHPPIRRYN
ncbi:MAG: M28 family peptidase [Gaiellales bacterium]